MKIEAYRYPLVALYCKPNNQVLKYKWGRLDSCTDTDLSNQEYDFIYELYKSDTDKKPAHIFMENEEDGASRVKSPGLVDDDPQNISESQEEWKKAVVVNQPRKHAWDEFVEKSNLNLDGSEYNVE